MEEQAGVIQVQSNPPVSLQYVGFWRRVAAYLIDAVVIFVIDIFLNVLHLGALGVIAGLVYFVYFWSQQNGQTPGDQALKIRIVREDGKQIDIMTGVIRYIGYIVSAFVIFLGFLWVIWDKKKQGWHDKMAGTVVVRV